ncbi:Hypothetical_protein [Hexamita inflata]|uniref:Hypothetical_protein n=1 Tax=Hexamita inflata TaxID=28002 RepID=A0AA86TNB4_9EUKA|nr:Hypothetical protein HINF_LOCUS10276 [Hexamita inflata]
MFGFVGFVNGVFKLTSASIIYFVNNGSFNMFGIIGYSYGNSSQLIDINIQTEINNNQGYCVGALAGKLKSNQIKLEQINIHNSYISGCHLVGLVVAYLIGGEVYQVTSTSSQVYCVSQTTYSLRGAYVGIIGETVVQLNIQMCIVLNISINSYSNQWWAISGGIVGDTHSSPVIMLKTSVQHSQISASGPVSISVSSGGLVGYIYNSTLLLQNVQVSNSNISGSNFISLVMCGGFFAVFRNMTTQINNCVIFSIQFSTQGQNVIVGILIGTDESLKQPFTTNNVISTGNNTLNEIYITNCDNIVSLTLSGC